MKSDHFECFTHLLSRIYSFPRMTLLERQKNPVEGGRPKETERRGTSATLTMLGKLKGTLRRSLSWPRGFDDSVHGFPGEQSPDGPRPPSSLSSPRTVGTMGPSGYLTPSMDGLDVADSAPPVLTRQVSCPELNENTVPGQSVMARKEAHKSKPLSTGRKQKVVARAGVGGYVEPKPGPGGYIESVPTWPRPKGRSDKSSETARKTRRANGEQLVPTGSHRSAATSPQSSPLATFPPPLSSGSSWLDGKIPRVGILKKTQLHNTHRRLQWAGTLDHIRVFEVTEEELEYLTYSRTIHGRAHWQQPCEVEEGPHRWS